MAHISPSVKTATQIANPAMVCAKQPRPETDPDKQVTERDHGHGLETARYCRQREFAEYDQGPVEGKEGAVDLWRKADSQDGESEGRAHLEEYKGDPKRRDEHPLKPPVAEERLR